MALLSSENLENWLKAKQRYIEAINKGETTNFKLPRGEMIKTPDDFKLMRQGVYHPDAPTADVASSVASPIDLGTALSSIVLDYPAALKRKAGGGQTSVFRIYGEPGVGKSESTRLVLRSLLQLHRVADEVAKGNLKKEDAVKSIANTAKHVFKPYTSFVAGDKEIDWHKWANDLIDSAAKYGKWENASTAANVSEAMDANQYAKIYALNRVFPETYPGERKVRIRDAIKSLAPVAQADDFLVNTDKTSSEHNLTDLVDMTGEKSMPSAVLVDTENVQDEVVDSHNLAFNSTVGRKNRSGIGMVVGAQTGERLQKASMETSYQMADDLFNSTVIDKLHTALFEKDASKRNTALNELKNGMELNSEVKHPMQVIDQIKQDLLSMTGGDEGKANEFLKSLSEGTFNFIATKSPNAYQKILENTGTNSLIDTLSDISGDAYGGSNEKINAFKKSIGQLLDSMGHDFRNKSRQQTSAEEHNKIINDEETAALLSDVFDNNQHLKEKLREKAGDLDPQKVEEDADREYEKKGKELDAELKAKAEKNGSIIENAVRDENKQYGESTLGDQLVTESKWDALFTKENKTHADHLFDFAKVFQNSKICMLTKDEIPVSEKNKYFDAGEIAGERLYINKDELANSRTFKQWKDIHDANMKYLGEEKGRAMTRELILGSHGPSLAAHVLLESLGLYEGKTQRGEIPFFEQFGSLKDKGLDFKEKYSEEDLKKAADLLNSLSGSSELKKLGAGQDSVSAEYAKQMNSLINEDGTINETVNKSLQGFEVLLDMAHKHSGDLLKHLDPNAMNDTAAFVGSLKAFSEKEGDFEFENMSDEAKKAVENRNKKNCKEGSNSLMEGAKTISPNVVKSNASNASVRSANERSKRLLGIVD